MAPLYLSAADVAKHLTVPAAMDVLEAAFRAEAAGQGETAPRVRMRTEGAMMHVLPGTLSGRGVLGLKAYVTTRQRASFCVLLFSQREGTLLAHLEADLLGQIRTGAASGLATRILAREDATVGALIGSGWQARSQVEALAAARPLTEIRVASRSLINATRFCEEMAPRVKAILKPVATAEEAVRGAHVVTTITTSRTPVLQGRWLFDGVHVNGAGSNAENRQELDEDAVLRAHVLVADNIPQAMAEAGDVIPLVKAGKISWDRFASLADVVAGKAPGRTSPEQVTLFESQGVALEDLSVAVHVYEQALAAGDGTPLA
ncbi:MAG: ornithine cyclodeaminase family protein [Armatimonadetes bacterium]|nr:ornithine cyclodeaminase family protein [Armatimonadota bacterium]